MTDFVYRLIEDADWRALAPGADLPLRDIDRRDGYLHLSGPDQVLETARLYFAARDDMLALAVAAAPLGDALRWEASRGGALFPHLYAALPARAVTRARALAWTGAAYRFADGENP